MKKKTLKKIFSGAAIFIAAANMNGCAYGPGPAASPTPVERPPEEFSLPEEFDESETQYFPKPSSDSSSEGTSEKPSDLLQS